MSEWEIKLKPCPFCGGKAHIEEKVTLGGSSIVWVECESCGARLPDIYVKSSYCANDKAAEAWNRRANNETV